MSSSEEESSSSSAAPLCEWCHKERAETRCGGCEHRLCSNCCRYCEICSEHICELCDEEGQEELECQRCGEKARLHGHVVGFSYRCRCGGKLVEK